MSNDTDDAARSEAAAGRPRVLPDTSFLRDVPLPLDEPVPARIGAYRIVRLLGEGGMGRVYEAEQESPRRFVALKVIRPHLVATARYRRRFAEEVRALGRFSHPAIARILEAGSAPDDRGELRLFCAMELVVGVPLDRHIRERALSPAAVAQLMAIVCDAVHHAHLKGVVHCDLKPGNIHVDVEGLPRILDFGIARLVGEEAREATASLGGEGAVVGTLAFASPEQAAGDRNRIDAMTDVYGLGATLFALLAGRPPHDVAACGLVEAARLIEMGSPLDLRRAIPGCPVNLHAIVDKATRTQQRDRYGSAAAMAADLRRFAAGRPVHARPAPWHETTLAWAGRNRLAAGAIVATAVALLAGLVLVSIAAIQLDAALELAQDAQRSHEVTRRAIEGSQRAVDDWHRRSTFLAEDLKPDEVGGGPARMLMASDWRRSTLAGRQAGRLITVDAEGGLVDRLDGRRTWAPWARPRFDVGGRFAESIDAARQIQTSLAMVANLDDDPQRELIRGIRFDSEHLHIALLEIEEVHSVVRHRGTPLASAIQLWSNGDVFDVAWDESRGLLWCVISSSELSWLVPELAAWDSAGCAHGLDDPRLLIALDPDHMHGVLPPLAGDADHRPIAPRWTFATRPPREVRLDGTTGEAPTRGQSPGQSLGKSPGEPGWFVDRLQIQAFDPFPADEDRGLGRLFLASRRAETEHNVVASVVLDQQGRPLGPLRFEPIREGSFGDRAAALMERTSPAEELLQIDLAAVSAAWPVADRLLREHGSREAAIAAAEALAVQRKSDPRDIGRCIEAMTGNWRWLSLSAAEILERSEVIARLGDPSARDAPLAAEVALAQDRMTAAMRLHAARCPAHGNGTCACEWFLESGLALALAAAGAWEECLDTTRRAIALHEALGTLGPSNPVDHAILAIALVVSGEDEAAHEALRIAEVALLEANVPLADSHQGSAGGLAPRLCARARQLVDGDIHKAVAD